MKRYFFITIIFYAVFLTFASYSVSKAYFADMAVSTGNSFTAANEFPTASTSATPTPTGTESTETDTTPSPTPTITDTPTPTPTPDTASHLVISEVQIAGVGTNNDFIELYNPTNSPINLNGYRLVKRTSTGTVDTSIKSFAISDSVPAHGFYLWANSTDGFATSIGANSSTIATLATSNSIALRNGDENTGVIIDAVGWGTLSGAPLVETIAFTPNPAPGQGLERKAHSSSTLASMTSGVDATKGNGFDGNNNSSDFLIRTTSQPQNNASLIEIP